jgi:hypothetical protein
VALQHALGTNGMVWCGANRLTDDRMRSMQQLLSNPQNFLSGEHQHLLSCERFFLPLANSFPFCPITQSAAQVFQFISLICPVSTVR